MACSINGSCNICLMALEHKSGSLFSAMFFLEVVTKDDTPPRPPLLPTLYFVFLLLYLMFWHLVYDVPMWL